MVASVDTPMESGDIATVTVVPIQLVGVDLSVLVQFVSERVKWLHSISYGFSKIKNRLK